MCERKREQANQSLYFCPKLWEITDRWIIDYSEILRNNSPQVRIVSVCQLLCLMHLLNYGSEGQTLRANFDHFVLGGGCADQRKHDYN